MQNPLLSKQVVGIPKRFYVGGALVVSHEHSKASLDYSKEASLEHGIEAAIKNAVEVKKLYEDDSSKHTVNGASENGVAA